MQKAIQRLLLAVIRLYQILLSPYFGQVCRFSPSCSRYAAAAIEDHGAGIGCWLGVKRLLRCHPWHRGGFDPVPVKKPRRCPEVKALTMLGLGLAAGLAAGLMVAKEVQAQENAKQLRGEDFVVELSREGAVRSFRLSGKRFRGKDGQPIELVTTDKPDYLPMQAMWEGVEVPASADWQVEPLPSRGWRFVWQDTKLHIERKVELGAGPYQIWSTWTVTNRSDRPVDMRPTLSLAHYVSHDAEGSNFLGARSPAVSFGVCQVGDKTLREDREELLGGLTRRGTTYFSGVENGHFALALAADAPLAQRCRLKTSHRGGTASEPHGTLFEAKLSYAKQAVPPRGQASYRVLQYLGPKDLQALRAAGHELPRIIDFGFFSFIAKGLVRLLGWIEAHVGNWGLAIILLTVLVKLLLYPLTEKSFQSMARMRLLKPQLDRIQELHKDDREKKGAAVMDLYRKNKINPVGGCLPSLLQLPVWFSLYASLSTNVELYHAPFLWWWQDLSAPDPYFILPMLLGALMFWQQKMTPVAMDPVQAKVMMYMMPVMITAFMLFLPAGLCLYMATNSVLGIAQQKLINHRLDRQAASIVAPAAETPTQTFPASTGSRRQRRGRA